MDRARGVSRFRPATPYVLIFVAALGIGTFLARPFAAASIAYDSQASTLHFMRIVEGRELESFVSTTSKPFLTVVFGGLFELSHDWRSLAWATLLAHAGAVTLM